MKQTASKSIKKVPYALGKQTWGENLKEARRCRYRLTHITTAQLNSMRRSCVPRKASIKLGSHPVAPIQINSITRELRNPLQFKFAFCSTQRIEGLADGSCWRTKCGKFLCWSEGAEVLEEGRLQELTMSQSKGLTPQHVVKCHEFLDRTVASSSLAFSMPIPIELSYFTLPVPPRTHNLINWAWSELVPTCVGMRAWHGRCVTRAANNLSSHAQLTLPLYIHPYGNETW